MYKCLPACTCIQNVCTWCPWWSKVGHQIPWHWDQIQLLCKSNRCSCPLSPLYTCLVLETESHCSLGRLAQAGPIFMTVPWHQLPQCWDCKRAPPTWCRRSVQFQCFPPFFSSHKMVCSRGFSQFRCVSLESTCHFCALSWKDCVFIFPQAQISGLHSAIDCSFF